MGREHVHEIDKSVGGRELLREEAKWSPPRATGAIADRRRPEVHIDESTADARLPLDRVPRFDWVAASCGGPVATGAGTGDHCAKAGERHARPSADKHRGKRGHDRSENNSGDDESDAFEELA
jgi:hypothetical protein